MFYNFLIHFHKLREKLCSFSDILAASWCMIKKVNCMSQLTFALHYRIDVVLTNLK